MWCSYAINLTQNLYLFCSDFDNKIKYIRIRCAAVDRPKITTNSINIDQYNIAIFDGIRNKIEIRNAWKSLVHRLQLIYHF